MSIFVSFSFKIAQHLSFGIQPSCTAQYQELQHECTIFTAEDGEDDGRNLRV